MNISWALAGVFIILRPGIAAAQEPPRVSAGASAGVAFPFHGDFDFTPWAWDADVRVAMARHALVEVAVGEWRHSETRVTENIRTTTPPGTIGRAEFTSARVQRTIQANLLFTGAAGRLRMNGGGGVGLLRHERRNTNVFENCSAGVSCPSGATKFSSGSGTAQAVGGAEVGVTSGFALYGQVRFVVPFTDPGGSDLRVTAGARVNFGGR